MEEDASTSNSHNDFKIPAQVGDVGGIRFPEGVVLVATNSPSGQLFPWPSLDFISYI